MAKYYYAYGSDNVEKNKETLSMFERVGVNVNVVPEAITRDMVVCAYTDKSGVDDIIVYPIKEAEGVLIHGEHISMACVKQYAPISDNANVNVNHPAHYTSHPSGVECIQITEHYNFCVGNAIKYLWRNGLKGEAGRTDKAKQIEDLEKAIWYINREIENLKK